MQMLANGGRDSEDGLRGRCLLAHQHSVGVDCTKAGRQFRGAQMQLANLGMRAVGGVVNAPSSCSGWCDAPPVCMHVYAWVCMRMHVYVHDMLHSTRPQTGE